MECKWFEHRKKRGPFMSHLMALCHVMHAETCQVGPKVHGKSRAPGEQLQGRQLMPSCIRRTRRTNISDDIGTLTEPPSSKLPGMAGEANDAVSPYTQVRMSDEKECPHVWIRLRPKRRPTYCDTVEEPVVPLERHLYGHPPAGLLWERRLQEVFC